jgi:hypothetical protein
MVSFAGDGGKDKMEAAWFVSWGVIQSKPLHSVKRSELFRHLLLLWTGLYWKQTDMEMRSTRAAAPYLLFLLILLASRRLGGSCAFINPQGEFSWKIVKADYNQLLSCLNISCWCYFTQRHRFRAIGERAQKMIQLDLCPIGEWAPRMMPRCKCSSPSISSFPSANLSPN